MFLLNDASPDTVKTESTFTFVLTINAELILTPEIILGEENLRFPPISIFALNEESP